MFTWKDNIQSFIKRTFKAKRKRLKKKKSIYFYFNNVLIQDLNREDFLVFPTSMYLFTNKNDIVSGLKDLFLSKRVL